MGKVSKIENPSLTSAKQVYEQDRLAAENKRLKRTIDEYLECIMSKDDQIVKLELKVEELEKSNKRNFYGAMALYFLLMILAAFR